MDGRRNAGGARGWRLSHVGWNRGGRGGAAAGGRTEGERGSGCAPAPRGAGDASSSLPELPLEPGGCTLGMGPSRYQPLGATLKPSRGNAVSVLLSVCGLGKRERNCCYTNTSNYMGFVFTQLLAF